MAHATPMQNGAPVDVKGEQYFLAMPTTKGATRLGLVSSR